MLDLLNDIRQQLDARLAELRPLVDEHGRLNAAMTALSETKPRTAGATPASSPVKTTSARAHNPPPTKRRKRAARGANRQAVLRAVSERPGGTRAELAAVSGVDANTLSALLTRLVKAGELQTRALPTGRTGYALADGTTAQPTGA